MPEQNLPKLCECGCGQPAPVATRTDRKNGYVRGEPRRFRSGHNPIPRPKRKRRANTKLVKASCVICGRAFTGWRKRGADPQHCSRRCLGETLRRRSVRPERAEVERLYAVEELSLKDLGDRYGRSASWAWRLLRYYGIERRTGGRVATGKDNVNTDWARRRREDRCRNCGSAGRLDLHHAVPRSLAPEHRYNPLNCITLCRSCHMKHHAGMPLPRAIFTADEQRELEKIAPSIGWLARRYPRTRKEAA